MRILVTLFCICATISALGQSLNLNNQPLLAQAQINVLPQSHLIAWWKSESLLTSYTNNQPLGNTTNGTVWLDSTGNGHNLAQDTVANRPLYHVGSAGILGGRACVDFSPNANQANFITTNAVSVSNFTMLFVVANINNDSLLLGSSTINRQVRRQDTTLRSFDGSGEAVSNPVFSRSTNAQLAVYKRTGTNFTFMTCTNLSFVTWPTNDVAAQMVLDNLGQCPTVGLSIGGFMGETAIYDIELTTNQVQQIYTNYFKPKYNMVN